MAKAQIFFCTTSVIAGERGKALSHNSREKDMPSRENVAALQ